MLRFVCLLLLLAIAGCGTPAAPAAKSLVDASNQAQTSVSRPKDATPATAVPTASKPLPTATATVKPTPTSRPTQTATRAATPTATATVKATATSGKCDPSYPDFCIPPPPPDLDCKDVAPHQRFTVKQPDPHRFDGDKNGIGCEGKR